jgi:acetyltransferase-like isoleucine patch superfamily enzyme
MLPPRKIENAEVEPTVETLRVALHRARGVRIGRGVWIGYDVILDTSRPHLITIEDGSSIGMRVTVIAHFRETQGVKIERDAFVGPGVIILPSWLAKEPWLPLEVW